MEGIGLAGRTAVVTGGAGGIGAAICRDLTALGAHVVIADVNEHAARQLSGSLAAGSVYGVDLGDPADTDRFMREVRRDVGEVDILVSNAGYSVVERFVDSDPQRWDALWRINLRAPIQLAHGFLPGMLERGQGRLVFISSDSARAGAGGEGVYSACKAGLFGLTKTLAREASGAGVTSNAVCPGPTDTAMTREIAQENPGMLDKLSKAIPVGRLGEPADVAGTVGFLCTDRASYITGQIISVSGGITMT